MPLNDFRVDFERVKFLSAAELDNSATAGLSDRESRTGFRSLEVWQPPNNRCVLKFADKVMELNADLAEIGLSVYNNRSENAVGLLTADGENIIWQAGCDWTGWRDLTVPCRGLSVNKLRIVIERGSGASANSVYLDDLVLKFQN